MQRTSRAVLAALLIFCLAGHAAAQVKGFEKTVLEDGMTVLTCEQEGELTAACIFVRVGAANEDPSTNGITNLLNHTILTCHPAGKIRPPALRIEQLGGSVGVETTSDYTCFTLVAPAKNFRQALSVLAAALTKPDCPDAALNFEKTALLNGEYRRDDRLVDRAYSLFLQKTYGGMPYGLDPEGDAKVVDGVRQADILTWQSGHYRPGDMVISICGRLNGDSVVRLVREMLKPAAGKGGQTGPNPAAMGAPVASCGAFEEAAPPGRATAVIGYTAPAFGHPDYAAMRLVEALLSDGMGARIFRTLRDDSELAYNFGSMMPPKRGTSRLSFYVVTDDDKIDAAVRGIESSVQALKDGRITDEEVVRAKGRSVGGLSLRQERVLDKASFAGLCELMGQGPDYPVRLAKEIGSLSKADIVKAAKTYMDKYTLVVMRPGNSGRF